MLGRLIVGEAKAAFNKVEIIKPSQLSNKVTRIMWRDCMVVDLRKTVLSIFLGKKK